MRYRLKDKILSKEVIGNVSNTTRAIQYIKDYINPKLIYFDGKRSYFQNLLTIIIRQE